MHDTLLYLLGFVLGWVTWGKSLISIEVTHRGHDQRPPSWY
ncbi:hypothetical protein [Nocardia jiangxiensis]|nr:hypothetical protein [Nocardia jiangxiensis]